MNPLKKWSQFQNGDLESLERVLEILCELDNLQPKNRSIEISYDLVSTLKMWCHFWLRNRKLKK